jgi:hypothetical protein
VSFETQVIDDLVRERLLHLLVQQRQNHFVPGEQDLLDALVLYDPIEGFDHHAGPARLRREAASARSGRSADPG